MMNNDDPMWERRADYLNDRRLDRIEVKIDRLEGRMNYLFGALAILSLVVNIIGPFVLPYLIGAKP